MASAVIITQYKTYLDRTQIQYLSSSSFSRGLVLFDCEYPPTANPFLNNRIPVGSLGVVVFTDWRLLCVFCEHYIASLMQSETINRRG